MTELEILQRAKQYVSKLANGVDPITDEEVSESDVVNRVRVSRCLFYVADVLQQVIDNGGKVSGGYVAPEPKKPKLRPFEISPESLASFSFYARPVAVSEMVRQLNDLSHDDTMKKLTYNRVAEWLLSEGVFCQMLDASGRKTNRPTDKGTAMGISVEKRTGQHGDFWVVLFNRDAQQFLIDHLPEILAFAPEKSEKKQEETGETAGQEKANQFRSGNAVVYTPWTEEDDSFLRELISRGASMGDLMLSLRRDSTEISARIKALHLTD